MTHEATNIQVVRKAMELCGVKEPSTTREETYAYISFHSDGNGDAKFVQDE